MMTDDGKSSSDFMDTLYHFVNTEDPPPIEKRDMCCRCRRPATVCWCPFLPEKPLSIKTNVVILQHPLEESRNLRTAPMLCECLAPGKVKIIKGKKFSQHRTPEVAEILRSPNTLVLYPGAEAISIEEIPVSDEPYNLVLLDGTWGQAKSMFLHNEVFTWCRTVKLSINTKSKYVIRTQPDDSSLSTLESAAVALSVLEQNTDIVQILTQPLEALCDFQIQHGACKHDSRVFKIENGLWQKALKKKYLKKMQDKQHTPKNENGVG